jgi:lipoyl(octanoyl) transferase
MNHIQNKKIVFQNLGSIDYKTAWDYQEKLLADTLKIKITNRDLPPESQVVTPNYLIFCEHSHVYTLGKSGDEHNLLINQAQLDEKEATFYKINRGGDITYHGPGQLVGYPIFDLDNFFTDIHLYMRTLEEAIILTLAHYEIVAGRIEGLTGVWLDHERRIAPRKICAMGVKASRWVTMHGFALNINTALDYFENIVPCGITDKAVTSMQAELNREVSMGEVSEILKNHLFRLFEAQV